MQGISVTTIIEGPDMKAVLLAAGRGSRLRHLTEEMPKPLMRVGQQTCLDIALEALSAVADEIIIVTGFLSEKIDRHLEKNPPSVAYRTVLNPSPEKGNLTSLEAARSQVEGHEFILTNADHLFPGNFYTDFFPASDSISVAGQYDRTIMDDEMKVVVNEDNQLQAISKTLPTFKGAYIGTTRVPADCAKDYWRAFDHVRQTQDPQTACVENILHQLASSGIQVQVHWVNNVNWFEVDTPEDLDFAREGLAS